MITVLFFVVSYKEMTVGRDSSISRATCYGLLGPVPVGVRFSALINTSARTHQTSYTMGTGSFPEVKQTGRGGDHTSPPSTEVKERVELYLCSLSGPSWPVLGCKR